jgi:hypothetical protein
VETNPGAKCKYRSEIRHLGAENVVCVDSSSHEEESSPATEIESVDKGNPSFVPLRPCPKDEGEVAETGTES